MFGLLRVDFDQLENNENVKEYKAHYCGLCHALSKDYGQLSRIVTNYEVTFLSLFFSVKRANKTIIAKNIFCPVSFTKKSIYQSKPDIVADISILLSYEKMIDDEYDDKKKFPDFIRSRIQKKYSKACERLKNKNFDAQYLKNLMNFQRKLEANQVHSFQKTSEPTALMMKYIFNFLSIINKKDEVTKSISNEIGYLLGKWMYLMDNVLDLEEDSLLNKFNPILLKCGNGRNKDIKLFNVPDSVKSEIKENFSKNLRKLKLSFDRIQVHENYNLIKYILTINLERKTDIIFEAMNNNNRSSMKGLAFLQASVAGIISSPKVVFASNGLEQTCGSCIGSIVACGVLFYAFKVMFRCNSGHMGCCCPCNMGRPNTIQFEDGCGGRKTLKRGFDGKYRDSNSCC